MNQFAQMRLLTIDNHPGEKIFWKIDGFGYLPELDWHSDFIARKKGPYRIEAMPSFPQACSSPNSLLVPTQFWVDKIAMKYQSDYHPFLYAKSLVRLPIGIGYGVLGVTGGVAIGVGGCAAASKASSGNSGLCQTSLEIAGAMISESANLVSYTLKPDLRRWRKLPSAIYLSQAGSELDPNSCLSSHSSMFRTMQLTPDWVAPKPEANLFLQ